MNPFSIWAYRFGSFVERRKMALLSIVFLAIPMAALAFSNARPSIGHSIFSPICHQNPQRSFAVVGSLPICARCFGLYVGLGLAGLLLPPFAFRFSKKLVSLTLLTSLAAFGLGFVFPALDANYVRLVFGLALGAGLALLIKSILK